MSTKQFSTWNAEQTNSGHVALWEKGGSRFGHDGEALIIAKRDGSMPTAVFIPRRGIIIANERHALIPVYPGYLVVKTTQKKGVFKNQIYKVVKTIPGETPQVELKMINQSSRGEWNRPLTAAEEILIKIAEAKAMQKNCLDAYYCRQSKRVAI